MTDEPAPTLKCIIVWSPRRNLCTIIADRLSSLIPPADLCALGDDASLAFTPITADALRDDLRSLVTPDEALLVIDFEAWSGYGRSLDATWLLAHGH